MTTMKIEVGRYSGTTVADVVEGLRKAGVMKYVEILPEGWEHINKEELRAALASELIHVEMVQPVDPPKPSLWRRFKWRIRVWIKGEPSFDEWLREMYPDSRIEELRTRSSGIMGLLEKRK